MVILILPVLKEWRLLVYGTRVEGIHAGFSYVALLDKRYSGEKIPRSSIKYAADDRIITVYGYEHIPYEPGEIIPLIVDRRNEKHFLIASVKGFIVRPQGAVLIIAILIWGAIFLTLRQTNN